MVKGATEADLFLNYTDMSVLDHQRAHLNYNHPGFDSTLAGLFSTSSMTEGDEIDGLLATAGFDLPVTTVESDPRLSISPTSATIGSGNFKKRMFDSVVRENKDRNEKKMRMVNRGEIEEEEVEEEKSEQNNGITKDIKKMKNKAKKEQSNCSNDSSKVRRELQKTDYIHVRARRGQATDSHSIAERVRREKISERMKYLQDLVPGCDKITGKAGMLDEIINYVQSLQRQIEFLSMKLATASPTLDFNMDHIFPRELVSIPMTNLPDIVMPSHEMVNSGYLHLSPMQQMVTNSDPLSCFNNCQTPSKWQSSLYSSLGL